LAQQQQQHPQQVPASVGAAGGPANVDPRRIREILGQNPTLLQPMIQQLAHNNPQLAQVLAQNPEALLELLGGGDEEGDIDGQHIPPGAQVVNITPDELAAIERVRHLPNHP
jgi:UV excision repair protein RAD23